MDALDADGYRQVMVFTQYADTMDFLREHLGQRGDRKLMCYSGRGGEIPDAAYASGWRTIARRRSQAPLSLEGCGGSPSLHGRRRRGLELPVLRRLGELRHAV